MLLKSVLFGRNTADAKSKRAEKAVETPKLREVRLELNILRKRQPIAPETQEQHETRLEQF